jgi:hypothetical protein
MQKKSIVVFVEDMDLFVTLNLATFKNILCIPIVCKSRLPRLIRVKASNTTGRVHQLQAFLLFLRGRHYTFVYLAA